MLPKPSMNVQKTKVRTPRVKSVVISARVTASLAMRLDWIVRNIEGFEDRTEGVKEAIQTWIEAREKQALTKGLFPPT